MSLLPCVQIGEKKGQSHYATKKWAHLTFGQRKTIANMIAFGKSAKEIAEALGCSPTAVSREMLRSRIMDSPGAKT